MPQYFVTATTAQIVSFGAKIIVGFTATRTACLLSSFSTPKALLFLFFGEFNNLFALMNDWRWYPSVRKHRSYYKSVELGSWMTIFMAFLLASSVLITDLLLFQLTARKNTYQFKPTTQNFTFPVKSYKLGAFEASFPEVLYSNKAAQQVFGNKVYISNDGGRYMNYHTHQDYEYTIDGPVGQIKLNESVEGDHRCTVAHVVNIFNAKVGTCPVRIRCYAEGKPTNGSYIYEETMLNVKIGGSIIASYYQTPEGANYLFVQLVQRAYEHLKTTDGLGGEEVLGSKIESLEAQGYILENARTFDLQLNMTTNKMTPMDIIKDSVSNSNSRYSNLGGDSVLLFSKTDRSYLYGFKPMVTKRFILCSTDLERNFFSTTGGKGNYFSYSYDVRQVLIRGAQLRPDLIGAYGHYFKNAPTSPEISTDRSDDEIILATLQDPQLPLEAISTVMIDIFPGLIVIGVCCLYVLVTACFHFLVKCNAYKAVSFEVNLEVFHKALDNISNGLNAWYLPAKIEQTSNVKMSNQVSLITNSFSIGLVSKGSTSGIKQLEGIHRPSTQRPELVQL